MYIQDEKQKIVGNLDIPGEWDELYQSSRMWTIVLVMPQIGAFVTYQGKPYVITRTETHQEEGAIPAITTFCVILRITDEGDDAGEPTIMVRSDELELI